MMTRAAQTHLAGHMRPAGRVFETPALPPTTSVEKRCSHLLAHIKAKLKRGNIIWALKQIQHALLKLFFVRLNKLFGHLFEF